MTEDTEITLPRPAVVTIRAAKRHDLPELNEMIALLAAHHGDAAGMTPDKLERDLFGPMPWIQALVADSGEGLMGYAILVPLYRADTGTRGMDLHHLFVRDGQRGNGIGLVGTTEPLSQRDPERLAAVHETPRCTSVEVVHVVHRGHAWD